MATVTASDSTTGTPSQTNESNIYDALRGILAQLTARNALQERIQERIESLETKEQRRVQELKGCASGVDFLESILPQVKQIQDRIESLETQEQRSRGCASDISLLGAALRSILPQIEQMQEWIESLKAGEEQRSLKVPLR